MWIDDPLESGAKGWYVGEKDEDNQPHGRGNFTYDQPNKGY